MKEIWLNKKRGKNLSQHNESLDSDGADDDGLMDLCRVKSDNNSVASVPCII